MSSSIAATLAQAIAYLTRPLIVQYSATTIIKLQLALEANLTAKYSSNWYPQDPLRGSGRRCLTLSPASTPPRPVYDACQSANVEWSQWIKLLGGVEFDLFIDPGAVSVRCASWATDNSLGKCLTVWSDSPSTADATTRTKPTMAPLSIQSKTLAQQLLEDDSREENELFAILADHVREPTWITPINTNFPPVQSPPSADSLSSIDRSTTHSPVSTHSRSSSRSSSSSSLFSHPESIDSFSTSESSEPKMSRRERARVAKVFIDNSKTQVTNYDGGKTTVLTGGVMLGAVSLKSKSPTSSPVSIPLSASSPNWRSSRYQVA